MRRSSLFSDHPGHKLATPTADPRRQLVAFMAAFWVGCLIVVIPCATQAASGIPASACWKYDSRTIGARDVSRWNELASQGTSGGRAPRSVTWFDDNHINYLVRHRFTQPCRMTETGQMNCEWSPGDKGEHTEFAIHGSSCIGDLKSPTALKENKLYQFGFDMCLPADINSGSKRFLITQIWSDARLGNGNPPIALTTSKKSGSTSLVMWVRGDTRSRGQFQSSGKSYQFVDSTVIARNIKGGKCYRFALEFLIDERPGGSGHVAVWMDGKKVYDLRETYRGRVQVGYSARHLTPRLGVYAGGKGDTAMSASYDNIWFMAP
jgi:hypothetical protein